MNDTSSLIQQRCSAWKRAKFPDDDTGIMGRVAKLFEEGGELARAIIGEHEKRQNRGDPILEAAQVVLVLLTLFGEFYPYADLYQEVEAELERAELALKATP